MDTNVTPTDLHLEVVEGMLIDVFHLFAEVHGIVGQGGYMRAAFLVIGGVVEARCGHVGAANGLYFLQLPVFLLTDDLQERRDIEGRFSEIYITVHKMLSYWSY